jgi:transcriptional regulator with XRE-family HTH domain
MRDVSLTHQFGLLIRRLRQQAGLSQESFAERCGLHRTYIGAIERGEKTVTIETANKLAHALSLPLSQIFLHLETQERERPNS